MTRESWRHSVFQTEFGSIVLLWSRESHQVKLKRILLSTPSESAQQKLRRFPVHSVLDTCPQIRSIIRMIDKFLRGNPIRFSLEGIDLDVCSRFQRLVLMAEYGIPRGSVSSYSRIGKHLGFHHAARAVGNALARNPFPIVIPCHRAIRSDNRLGGFQGGFEMKKCLLEMEGHRFDRSRRLIEPQFEY